MRRTILRRRTLPGILFLLVFAAFVPSNSFAADVKLTDDASTSSQQPNKNTGDDKNLTVERTSGNNPKLWNSYIKFSLSTLPAGTVGNDVVKATLRIWMNEVKTAGSFDVHRVTGPWNEFGITFATAPGSVAEVTGIAVTSVDQGSFLTVDLTALVKDWLNGVLPNNGIALIANAAGTSVQFDSKENEKTSHEARLEILLKGPVVPDSTLAGDGTTNSPLGIANGAITAGKIASGQVVKSLNSLTDNVTLSGGTNITVASSGNTLTVAAPNTLTSVMRDGTLAGDGTSGSPLGVATGGIGTNQLANGAVTAGKIASGQVVKSLNGLFDGVSLLAGTNITITPSGNTLTFAAPNSLSFISHDFTLSGTGTSSFPLGLALPLNVGGATTVGGLVKVTNGGSITSCGIFCSNIPVGVEGVANNGTGVEGASNGGTGVRGKSISGTGVHAFSNSGDAIFAQSVSGRAGAFIGNVEVAFGNLNVSGTKNFKIDHPLDAENKYLYHAAIESSEVLNVYSGNVRLNEKAEGVVQLPDWFDAINRDFRYSLTAIGAPASGLYIAQEISKNRFVIAGGMPGMKVSWQVTGVRSDAVMVKHPFKTEEDKAENERGYYLNPDAYNQPAEKSVEWGRNPKLMQQLKHSQEQGK